MRILQQKILAVILSCSESRVCRLVKKYREDRNLKSYAPVVWEEFADWLGVPKELADEYVKKK